MSEMSTNQNIQKLLESTLNAEMSIRSITTKIQRIREAQAEYEMYKEMLNQQMLENYYNEKNNITVSNFSLKREKDLGVVVSSLEYLMLSRYGDESSRLEEEIESFKELVEKIPSRLDKSIVFNKNNSK